MDIPKAHTFRRALEEGINLFLGAGNPPIFRSTYK